MSAVVTLTVTRGRLKGQKFTFCEPAQCVIGRARDCTLRLPREPGDLDISRHHCVLETASSGVRLRDLGSLNGTFVNGRLIGRRAPGSTAEYIPTSDLPAQPLQSGDHIWVGGAVFHILIQQVSHRLQSEDTLCVTA